jgi:hypothetical protein
VTHAGHGQHADDIIPAFTYSVKGTQRSYPGKNLDTVFNGTSGRDLLADGCAAPTAEPSGGTSGDHNGHPHNGKVTLCHATPPATAKNGWVQITVSTNAVTHAGHGQHADDIIPAFTYSVKGTQYSYPGKNLDTVFNGTSGRDLLAEGCPTATPSGEGAQPTDTATSTDAPQPGIATQPTNAAQSSGAAQPVVGGSGTTNESSAGTGRTSAAGGSGVDGESVDAGSGSAGGAGVDAAQADAGRAPAGAAASGLAVGDTGDHGSGPLSGAGMTAAVVGAALAGLLGLGALALRRRRNDDAGA